MTTGKQKTDKFNPLTSFLEQVGLNPEQLQEFLTLQAANQTKDKEWLTPRELEQEFSFSQSTQAKHRMGRKIPFSKIGKYIRYNRTEINKWLNDNRIEVA